MSYLSTIKVVSIGRLEHGDIGHDGVDLLVHHLEVAWVAEREGPMQRERLRPGKGGVKEVARDVHVVVTGAERYDVGLFPIDKTIHSNLELGFL